jgi:serine/threonine-protein kinase
MVPDEFRDGVHPPEANSDTRDWWRATSDIVDAALELPLQARPAFLARACTNAEMRTEVECLLAACEQSGGFLDGEARVFAAPLLAPGDSPREEDEAAALARLRQVLAARYAVAHEIGRGGTAMVYLARDVRHGRDVAIKLLRPELIALLGAGRFSREIETTTRLRHDHILPVLDAGEAPGLLYYVAPYIAGESLRERLDRETRLAERDAVRIAVQIASALDYAHRHEILHRDLKPENVLLAHDRAILADFGIARAIARTRGRGSAGTSRTSLTATGFTLGTPAYMSPEQAAGSRAMDGRSDIYSLGCLLYEMLAGVPPFRGPTADNVIRQHVSAAVPTLASARRDLAPGVVGAVRRAMSKAPGDRFITMAAFADALTAPNSSGAVRRWLSNARDGLARRLASARRTVER